MDDQKAELEPKPEWSASISGFSIYVDRRISPHCLQVLDKEDRIIAIIPYLGCKIHIGRL